MTKKLKILLVSINYAPEIISTAVYSTGFAEFFSKRGHDVSVICAQPYYPAWKVMQGWPRFSYRAEQSDSGVRITHCPLYVPAHPTGLKRMLHHISFGMTALPVAIYKSFRERPDIVFFVAPALLSAPTAAVAARVSGAKYWGHVQDFEVDAAFATGLLNDTGLIGRLARKFERWAYRSFDRVSSISRPMLDKLERFGIPSGDIFELRNWANLSTITPVSGVSPMRSELGITTKYVALYSGNLANKQGLEILPKLAKELAHRDDLTILVCGDGPMREALIQASKGFKSIIFVPLQPLSKLSDLLGAADVHLLPQIEGAQDLVLPSKLTNMLASGRPVVATADSGTALADEVEGCGIITPPGDAKKMAAGLETLLDNPKQHAKMSKRAVERAHERWNGEAILGRLEKEFELICTKTTP